uniref:Uncharacterized protein n=1 Tax=Anopheles melas TaxID=34690 RepID=A0A182TMR0_9DIPT
MTMSANRGVIMQPMACFSRPFGMFGVLLVFFSISPNVMTVVQKIQVVMYHQQSMQQPVINIVTRRIIVPLPNHGPAVDHNPSLSLPFVNRFTATARPLARQMPKLIVSQYAEDKYFQIHR